MANLNASMTEAEINRLDYFDKAQLYHNVYINMPYNQLPQSMKKFYNEDQGLSSVKAVLVNSNLQDPYEIAKIIKALNPAKPQTLQEIYVRAKYLADVCDTTVEKVLRSNLFNTEDFIPQLNENILNKTLKVGTVGTPVPLKNEDYTPAPVTPTPGGGGDEPTISGDYANENKIYFTINGNNVSCNTPFSKVIEKLPKLPDAELVRNSLDDYQNISNIACGYDEFSRTVHFNFIQIYTSVIKLFTIHYSASGATLEENEFMIDANI
jgi:hypothetical protein